jgi:hypothetical protein
MFKKLFDEVAENFELKQWAPRLYGITDDWINRLMGSHL